MVLNKNQIFRIQVLFDFYSKPCIPMVLNKNQIGLGYGILATLQNLGIILNY